MTNTVTNRDSMKSPSYLVDSIIFIYQKVHLKVNFKLLHITGPTVLFLDKSKKYKNSDHHNALKSHLYKHELQQAKENCDG